MTKHTPGPWEVIPASFSYDEFTISAMDPEGARFKPLASATEYVHHIPHLNITRDEAEANANLIAAAPEQNTALIEIERLALDMGGKTPAQRCALIAEIARAAIAKAEGRS